MNVFIDQESAGGIPEGGAFLVCEDCETNLMGSGNGPIDLDLLVGILQAHKYDCTNLVTILDKYCGICGEQLYKTKQVPTPRCRRCNLLIPEAMQTDKPEPRLRRIK